MRPLGAAALLLGIATGVWAERLPVRTYSTADGLGSPFVVRIVADSKGFLWFCTRNGLNRFDGERFTLYGLDEGLPDATVNDLLEDRDGAYWIATNGGGVARLDPRLPYGRRAGGRGRRFTVFQVGDSAATNSVNRLCQDRRGRIWAATDGGLFRLDGALGSFALVPLDLPFAGRAEESVQTLALDDEGSVWVGLGLRGLRCIRLDGTIEAVTAKERLPSERVWAILPVRGGRTWIGTAQGAALVSRDAGGRLACSRVGPRENLSPYEVQDMLLARDGRLFLATSGGLSELDGERLRHYTSRHGLAENELTSLGEDLDGNLWIGTQGSGAMKLTRGGFTRYDEADAPGFGRVHSVFEGSDGAVYVVGGDWYVQRLEGERFRAARLPVPATALYYWLSPMAHRDRRGDWWVLTGQGLFRYAAIARLGELARARPAAVYDRAHGLPGDGVNRIYEDSHGDVWIGTVSGPSGLARWERGTGALRVYGEAEGLPALRSSSCFEQDRGGNLWIGFTEGVGRLRGGRVELFDPSAGWPRGGVMDLYLDSVGRLWLASNRDGLWRVDEPEAERPRAIAYTTAEGLATNNTRCVTEDRWGRLYVGTARGLDRLDPTSGRVRHFTTTDGLSSDFLVSAARDSAGRLWFATFKGLSLLTPEPDRPFRPPPVLIGGLGIAGAAYPVSETGEHEIGGLRLAAGENRLQFQFLSMVFGLGQAVRFQYRLEGAEPNWGPPVSERSVSYAGLPPGRYRFLVKAVDADGLESVSPASVSFEILPPFWRRGWFLTSIALALAGLAVAFHRARVTRLLAVERVRTRIATDLHDDLGSSLSRIAILSEAARGELGAENGAADSRLAEIADTARDLLGATADIVWSVHPGRDDLASLAARVRDFASEQLEARGIAWSLEVPPEAARIQLPPERRWHLLLILKEALHNVVRHAEARNVRLAFQTSDRQIVVQLSDDGRGFEAESADSGEPRGHGLRSIRARAAELHAKLDIVSARGRGTTLRLTLAL